MKRLLDMAWEAAYDQTDEFWCMLDAEGIIVKANSSMREWFYIATGTELVGLEQNMKSKLGVLEKVDDDGWAVMSQTCDVFHARTHHRMKYIKNRGEVIGSIVNARYIDETIMTVSPQIAQLRLSAINNEQVQPADNVIYAKFG